MQARISGGPTVTQNPRAAVEWRAALHPAQLIDTQLRRPWVAGVGYVGRHVGVLGVRHGIYGETGYAHVRRTGKNRVRRLSLTIAPEMMRRSDDNAWGYGASASVGLEWVVRARSKDGPGDDYLAAAAHGEGGFGFTMSGGFERTGERDVGFVLVGLRVSVPAFAGLIFAPDLLLSVLRGL